MSIRATLKRLQLACVQVSGVLDTGARDPSWHETQELENAAIAYGRALRHAKTDPGFGPEVGDIASSDEAGSMSCTDNGGRRGRSGSSERSTHASLASHPTTSTLSGAREGSAQAPVRRRRVAP